MRFLRSNPHLFLWLLCPIIFAQESTEKDPNCEHKPKVSFAYKIQTDSSDDQKKNGKANVVVTANGKSFPISTTGNANVFVTGSAEGEDGNPKSITVFAATGKDQNGSPFALEFNPNHGFLGIESVELTEELRLHFGAPEETGIMIGRVTKNGPAFEADLKVGDILTHLDQKPVASAAQLLRILMTKKPNEAVEAEVWRDGQTIGTTVILGELDPKEYFFWNQNPMVDVIFEQSNHSNFNFNTWQDGESPVVEWVEVDQKNMTEQLKTLQKKIEELEKRILKEKEKDF